MKTTVVILSAVIVVLVGLLFLAQIEASQYDKIQQREIDFLKAKNIQERDLLQKQLELTRDSLSTAYQNIAIAHKQSQEARERTQRMIKNYEQIIFIKYASDSARHRKLAELYPSYRIH